MSRFCAAPYSLVVHNKGWGVEEFELSYCYLELDFLGSRKLVTVITDKVKAAEKKKDDDGEPPPLTDLAPDEMAIRAVSRNAPVVAYQMVVVSKRLNNRNPSNHLTQYNIVQ